MIVRIPMVEQHCGISLYLGRYRIRRRCPKCGARRGIKKWQGFSFDGSRKLIVDCWKNECGHIDLYSDVRKEGKLIRRWATA